MPIIEKVCDDIDINKKRNEKCIPFYEYCFHKKKGFTDIRISYNIIGIKYKKYVIIFHHLVIKVNKNIMQALDLTFSGFNVVSLHMGTYRAALNLLEYYLIFYKELILNTKLFKKMQIREATSFNFT